MHPDQLCSFWTTADLMFEKILSLERKADTDQLLFKFYCYQQQLKFTFMSFFPQKLTRALSKLRICPWKAAGLFKAAIQNIFINLLYSQIIIIIFLNVSWVISINQGTTLLLFPTHATIASSGWLLQLLTWHNALLHQLLPGSPLLESQLQHWKQTWKSKFNCNVEKKMRNLA